MSYTSLFGAFPIASDGDSFDPKPNEFVGDLRGGSRNGVFFRVMRELLTVLPAHASLRFLAHEAESADRASPDSEVFWTVLDKNSLALVVTELDCLLSACAERAAVVADSVCFGSDYLTAEQIRSLLESVKESSALNAEARCEEGESAEFVFTALVSLRGLLRRAVVRSERIAIFTWGPG
jgi:hypothetical protein